MPELDRTQLELLVHEFLNQYLCILLREDFRSEHFEIEDYTVGPPGDTNLRFELRAFGGAEVKITGIAQWTHLLDTGSDVPDILSVDIKVGPKHIPPSLSVDPHYGKHHGPSPFLR